MDYLVHWVAQVVLIVLFAVILELLLPAGSFQKYIKFVIGLVLIVALLDPVIRLLHVDPDRLINGMTDEQSGTAVKNETAVQKNEIEKTQAAYIQKQVAVQMKNQVKEELNEKYGLQIEHMALATKKNSGQELSLDRVTVAVAEAQTKQSTGESGSHTIQPVKPVSINAPGDSAADRQQAAAREPRKLNSVRSFLAGKWGISPSLIRMQWEGGG